MKVGKRLQMVALGLGLSVAAFAAPVSITYQGGYGNPVTGTVTNGDVELYYPYVLIVNGAKITVTCDAVNNLVIPGESWQATVNTFTDSTGSGITGGMFSTQAGALLDYQKAAWLTTQYDPLTQAPPNYNQDEVNAAINYAIWDLFNGGNPQLLQDGANPATASSYWLAAAATAATNNFYGLDFSNFVIYTPNGVGTPEGTMPQEYIGEVPEPGTLALFATGLLGLAWWFERRQRSATATGPA